MPLTDLCNRLTARAPERPRDSRFSNACDAREAGGGSVDAKPPASGGLTTLSRDEARKEERRTGAALRCVGVFGRAQRSKPNPLTPPVPLLRLRTDVTVPPSKGTPSPARGAFHRPVSPSLLAHRRKPATSPAAWPPLGRLPTPRHLQRRWGRRFRISFRLRLNDEPTSASRAHHPGAGQVWRRLSTSAITTVLQHKLRSDRPPCASGRELRPCSMDAGSPAPRGAGPVELSPSQGPPRT